MEAALERYLRTGHCDDIDHLQWPGQNIMEKGRNGHDDHVRALVAEVKKRSKGRKHAAVPELDLTAWTRRKLTPMVHGFFPESEREAVILHSVAGLNTNEIATIMRISPAAAGRRISRGKEHFRHIYVDAVDD